MKRMLRLTAYVLALNFFAVAGGAAYLWRTGHLDRGRVAAIKAILFPAPPPQAKDKQTASSSTTQPSVQLEELLKKASGRSAEEQVEFLQRAFDGRMAQLDLRQRGLDDQQRLVDFGSAKLAGERTALDAEKKRVAAAEQQATIQANDQGFQDSLALYGVMPAKQVKTIFMTLSNGTIERYLEAMTPGKAGKIIKEFKTADETDRIQKVLERMRLRSGSDAQPTATTNPP